MARLSCLMTSFLRETNKKLGLCDTRSKQDQPNGPVFLFLLQFLYLINNFLIIHCLKDHFFPNSSHRSTFLLHSKLQGEWVGVKHSRRAGLGGWVGSDLGLKDLWRVHRVISVISDPIAPIYGNHEPQSHLVHHHHPTFRWEYDNDLMNMLTICDARMTIAQTEDFGAKQPMTHFNFHI